MPQPSEKLTPYDDIDTELWKLDRRLYKSELHLDSLDARLDRIEESVRGLRNQMFNWVIFFTGTIIVASTFFKALFDSIGQTRDKRVNSRSSAIHFKGAYPCGIIFLSCEANSVKKRSKQQMIDPYDLPREDSEVYIVEEEENITEEVEITLEELKRAYNLTAEELKKIWADHRGKQNNG